MATSRTVAIMSDRRQALTADYGAGVGPKIGTEKLGGPLEPAAGISRLGTPLGGKALWFGMTKTLSGVGAGLVSTMPTVADTKKTTIPNSSRRAKKGVRRSSMAAGSGDHLRRRRERHELGRRRHEP
jgi:hypothetical protein